MKNRIKKIKAGRMLAGIVITTLLCIALWAAKAPDVFAYIFAKESAEEDGTVTVSARAGAVQENGYSTQGGYRVTYTITRENWTAFDDRFGGYFVVGNDMDTRGGCQFAYHTSGGELWEGGAVILGYLRDGRQITRCDVESGTVSCSFDVNSLEEIPEYIAYAYQPASGAYLHINSDMGTNAHVWYYKSLKDVPVIGNDSIDTEGPVLTSSVIPTGATADVGGKIWSTEARIQLRAEDGKSRPGGIRIYKDGNSVHEKDNPGNEVILETVYDINENGSFQADAYDKLNNISDKITVDISCIDRQAPDIRSLKTETAKYAKETKLLAEASDAGCGLHALAYSWNGGAWTNKKEFKVTANGTYTLKVRDALGNESRKTITVSNIDREGPDIHSLKAETTKYVRETNLLAEVSDAGCGLHALPYSWNDGAWTDKKEFKVTASGTYTLKVRDALGNESKKALTVINIDREGPEITQKVTRTGKTETYQGIIWSTEAEVSVQASDDKSGMSIIRILNGKDETEEELQNTEDKGTNKLQLEKIKIKNGSYKIWASDVLGNTAVTESFEVSHVDGEAPIIREIKTTPLEDGSILLTVTAEDGEDGIGLDDEAYSFDGGKTWQKEASIIIKENGGYEILVRDRLHQEISEEKQVTEVSIKEKPDKDDGDEENKKTDTEEPDNQDKEKPNGQEQGNTEEPDNETEEPSGTEEPGGQGDGGDNSGNKPDVVNSPVNPAVNPAVNPGRTTASGRRIQKTTGSDRSKEISVSKNDIGNTVVTKKRVVPEKALKDAEEKVLSEISPGADSKGDTTGSKEEQMVRKTILFILATLFAAGCIGLILYLLLFYLRYSCVLYGIEEDQKRHRLCRLPVKEKEEEWQVIVPDHKLGLHGTGKYLLVFHPSFVKEEAPAFVIIQIDGKALREKLEEEISINI